MNATIGRGATEKKVIRGANSILLVEDSLGDARLVQEALREANGTGPLSERMQVETVALLAEAVEAVMNGSFRAALLDLDLPDSQGLDTVHRLHQAAPKLPIVVLTGNPDPRIAIEALQAGAQDHLVKGKIDGHGLLQSLRYATERQGFADRLEEQELFNREVLGSLTSHIAVLDGDGQIVATNQAWEDFAADNGIEPKEVGSGANYFAACQQAAQEGDDLAAQALEGLQSILSGEAETYSLEYPCHSPARERWFRLQASSFHGQDAGVVVAHEEVTERWQAEVKLARREQEVRTLLENSPAVIARYDLLGRHLYVNPAVEQRTGLRPAEHIGKTDRDLGVPAAREKQWRLARERVMQTGRPQVIAFSTRQEGEKHFFQTEVLPEFSSDGRVETILTISHDITDLHRANENLRSRESVLEAVSFASERFATADEWRSVIGAVLARLGQAVAVDRAYVWRNDRNPEGELVGMRESSWSSDADFSIVGREEVEYDQAGLARWKEVLAAGGVIQGATVDFPTQERKLLEALQIRSQVVVPVFVGDLWWGFIGFDDCRRERNWDASVVDVLRTAAAILGGVIGREHAERQLVDRERRFRALVENSWDAVAISDRTGNVLYASPSTKRVLGIPAEQFVGMNGFDLIHPEEREQIRANFVDVARDDQRLRRSEMRAKDPDGGWRWIEARATDLLDDPAVGGLVVNFRDVTQRRRARQKLERSEAHFRSVIENVTDLIAIIDREGIFRYLSPSGGRILGMPAEGHLGLKIWQYVHPDDLERIAQVFDEVYLNPGEERRVQLRVRDAARGWIAMEAIGQVRADDETLVVSARDISERLEMEQELRRERDLFSQLAEASPAGIVMVDRRGTILFANDRVAEILGVAVAELEGMHYEDRSWLFRDQAGALVPAGKLPFAKVVEGGQPMFGMHHLIERPDGEQQLMSINGSPIVGEDGEVEWAVFTIEDITSEVEQQRHLEASERRFRSLVQNASDIITIVDSEGSVLYESPALERVMGYPPEAVLGLHIFDSVHPEDRPAAEAAFADLLEDPESEMRMELRLRGADGELRHLEVVGTNSLSDSAVGGIVFNSRDVSARWRREMEQEAIMQVAAALRDARTRDEMPPIILHQVTQLLEAGGAAMTSFEEGSGRRWVEMAIGSWAATGGLELGSEQEIDQEIYATGKPYLCDDVRHDPRFLGAELIEDGATAAVAVPLIAQQQSLGTLWVGRDRPFEGAEGRILAAVADMAGNALRRARLHEETQHRAGQMQIVSQMGQELSETLDEYAIYERLVEASKQLLHGISSVIVSRYDQQANTVRCVLGEHLGERIDATELQAVSLEPPAGSCGHKAFQNQETVICHDVQQLGRDVSTVMLGAAGMAAASGLCVPMRAEGRVVGLLQAQSTEPYRFTDLDAEVMSLLANTAAVALENADLVRDIQGSTVELAMAYDTTLEGWARALELRDKETEGHARRVTDLTVQLAVRLGVPAENLVNYRRGALLHDIGKMGIPDEILLKPGKLTEGEWEIMRRHPMMAYEMLENVDFLRSALEIPRYHHERWDGSGYPEGLRGQEIPLSARVFAVVDIYDALRSDRPYRQAWSEQETRRYLAETRGVELDPGIVDEFLTLLDEGPMVVEQSLPV